ncbi:hypothetical protein NDU88_003072 [Pleurodeles waltl]|uniref:Uncharacterized protein n=1 Tax=Pleurodeles waltl TaxID=8319 RepID=A0AAV7SFJ6_PLEWA|nr:hypothetical protein NDU88_003072 [Pleurodeles waltl]
MMATHKQGKKDSNLRDLFAKTPVKKQDPGGGSGDETVKEDTNSVTKAFMEQPFGVLREDLAALRLELATTVKELKGEVTELGQSVDTVERTCDRQEEELDHHSQEIIALQDGNWDLQYRLKDLENRSR